MIAPLGLFAALLLLGSALTKARDPARARTATGRLTGTRGMWPGLLALGAGLVEVAAGVGLIAAPLTGAMVPAFAAAALWATYALALWLRRGQVLDCGCDWAATARAIDTAQVVRPALLALLALGLGLRGTTELPGPIDWIAAFALVALYGAASEILAIPRPRWRTA